MNVVLILLQCNHIKYRNIVNPKTVMKGNAKNHQFKQTFAEILFIILTTSCNRLPRFGVTAPLHHPPNYPYFHTHTRAADEILKFVTPWPPRQKLT